MNNDKPTLDELTRCKSKRANQAFKHKCNPRAALKLLLRNAQLIDLTRDLSQEVFCGK